MNKNFSNFTMKKEEPIIELTDIVKAGSTDIIELTDVVEYGPDVIIDLVDLVEKNDSFNINNLAKILEEEFPKPELKILNDELTIEEAVTIIMAENNSSVTAKVEPEVKAEEIAPAPSADDILAAYRAQKDVHDAKKQAQEKARNVARARASFSR